MNKKSYYLILGYNFLDYFIEEIKENYPMFDSIDKDQAIEQIHIRQVIEKMTQKTKLYLLEITEVIPNA